MTHFIDLVEIVMGLGQEMVFVFCDKVAFLGGFLLVVFLVSFLMIYRIKSLLQHSSSLVKRGTPICGPICELLQLFNERSIVLNSQIDLLSFVVYWID